MEKSLYVVGREVLTPLFYEDPPYIAYHSPLFKFYPTLTLPCHLQPPPPTVLSVFLFLWLNGWSQHIWCAILLNDNMDLNMSSLGTLVPERPWCVFFATRIQVYWGLTQCGFLLVIWFDITHTNTHYTRVSKHIFDTAL